MSHDQITDQEQEDLLARELSLLAHDPSAPHSSVDIAQAVQVARGRLRRRRVRTSAIALVLAVAVAVSVTMLPGAHHDSFPQHHGSNAHKDPMITNAHFTWLPQGITASEYLGDGFVPGAAMARAEAWHPVPNTPWPPAMADVYVYPKGVDPAVRGAADNSWKHRIQAPDVNGRPAYWMSETADRLDGFGVLRWQTADGRWAEIRFLYWNPKAGQDLLHMAEGVVVADSPVPMPFYISGLPTGYKATTADLQLRSHTRTGDRTGWWGRVGFTYQGYQLMVGAGSRQDGSQEPPTDIGPVSARVCSDNHDVEVCVMSQWHRNQKPPAFATATGLRTILRAVHTLGADQANWTTDVLR